MKTYITVLFILSLGLSGCATAGRAPESAVERRAMTLQFATSVGAARALSNNPEYVLVAQSLSAGIDAVLAKEATLDPQRIAAFVRSICARHELSAGETAEWTNLALGIYDAYVETLRLQVVSTLDPTVRRYVLAFKTGLDRAILSATP